MSRLGKLPVELPSGVEVAVSGKTITVKGPKGSTSVEMGEGVGIEVNDKEVQVVCNSTRPQAKANYGTTRALVNNMVVGVTNGWTKKLLLSGVGYNAKVNGKTLVLAVGFSHDVNLEVPENVDCKSNGTAIELESVDKNSVGTFAAKIRGICPPEPYLGKGIRYDGEVVRRKAGKSGR